MTRFSTSIVAALLTIAGVAAVHASTQEQQQAAQDQQQSQKPHPSAFLQKLVGEWSATTYAVTDPNEEPYRFEGQEHARMLGRQWLISEYTSEVEGQTLHSLLTIGYDPAKGKFVATYANAMQTMLWTYEGTLNEDGSTLTLKTEGPFMGDPNQKANYRVLIDRDDEADTWSMSSQIHMAEQDEWFEFLRFEYERKD